MFNLHSPTRRELLRSSGVLFAWAYLPKVALAEGRDPRMLVIVLRGALDGLSAVAPVGDPDWVKLRGDAAVILDGPTPALALDSFFALNPAMPNLHRLYKAGQATILHAVATPYRGRSHFDGQDVLESGYASPGYVDTGWLNRALTSLAPADAVKGRDRSVMSIGSVAPLVVRGPAKILSWVPPSLPATSSDTLTRLLDLYRHTDPMLAQILEERIGLDAIVGADGMGGGSGEGKSGRRARAYFAQSAGVAAKFLARPDGPRIGAISFEGWDTHANEGPLNGTLATLLSALDGAVAAVETEMGATWRETVVAVVTEFGRTARMNGTRGTDHGTGTVAFLAGGALKGGRVIADWPGLKPSNLLGDRDLKPTLDLRAALKGLLKDHVRVADADLDARVFPDSRLVRSMEGLVS